MSYEEVAHITKAEDMTVEMIRASTDAQNLFESGYSVSLALNCTPDLRGGAEIIRQVIRSMQ